VGVPDGAIQLDFERSSGVTDVAPPYWYYRKYNLSVGGVTSFDVTLPAVTVSGTVTDASFAAVPNASVQISSYKYDSAAQIETYSSGTVSTTSAGTYSILMLVGNANFTVRPPSGSSSTPVTVSNVALNADLQRNFALGQAVAVSGTVRGVGGQAISGVSVSAYIQSTGQYLASATTNASGFYSVGVPDGAVRLDFERSSGVTGVAPPYWYYRKYNLSVAGDTTFDVNLNVVRLNGAATDSNGSPIANVTIQSNAYSYNSTTGVEQYSSGSVASDPSGSYSMLMLAATGNVTVRPTTSSGFSVVSLSNVNLNSNLTQRIVLQRPDSTPPVIVTNPVVVHLSDTSVSVGWTTNEPASSRVEFGLGGLTSNITSNTLTTNHSITLVDLAPTAIYTFRVGSTDKSGNGPTFSATAYFTTQAPPGDVTPPVITSGPAIASSADTSAIVQWSTDEPATSVVEFGESASLGSAAQSPAGVFTKSHSISLSGLRASTTYYARVSSVDPDGNGPTASSVFTFTTAAAPDTQPPVIQGLAAISVTHNAITIAWTTNEAATTGVSYNDGGVYNVVSDPGYVTSHQVTLAGLSAQRTYSITVSSKDAAGNGPTLAGPIQVTTLSAPDVTAPVISSISTVPAKRSAALSWSTSEAASSEVHYGKVSGNPDNFLASVSLSTSHNASLTGLDPSTTYFVVIRATDAAGNTAAFSEFTFQTLAGELNVAPTAPGPFSVSSNPNSTGTFSVTWGASTDDGAGGVASYTVYRNGAIVAQLPFSSTSHSESNLPQGDYVYIIRATDAEGLYTDSAAVSVVVDTTAPALNMPGTVSVPASTSTDAIVTYSVTATDNKDSAPVVSCSPSSGTSFSIGTTPVACSATDAAGNRATGSFNVVVTDPYPPVLTVPQEVRAEATSEGSVNVTFTVTATDNADPNPSIVCTPASGSLFAVGTTTVSCVATDASSNSVTRTFNVIVTAPPIAATTTSVTYSPAAPSYGQPVTLSASVASGSGTPSGSVEFYDGAALLGTATLSAATASINVPSFNAGSHSITAQYKGSASHAASTSPAVSLAVAKATPVVTITVGTFQYDGQPHAATAVASGVGGASLSGVTVTYNGASSAPVDAGTYDVQATIAESENYNAASATSTLTINKASATITLSGLLWCYDGQPKQATATVTPNVSGLSVVYNGSATLPVEEGSYSVAATLNHLNYAAPAANATLRISRVDSAITASGPTEFCAGGNVILSSAATAGSTLTWYRDGVQVAGGVASMTVTTSGRYTLVARNSDLCQVTSSPVDVVVRPLPAVPVVTTNVAAGQATLSSSPASSYQWSRDGVLLGGATQQTLTTSDSGSYTVTVTNEYGCAITSAPSAVTITRNGDSSYSFDGVTVSTDSFPDGTVLSIDSDPAIPPAPSGYYTLTDGTGNLVMAYEIKATSTATGRIEITFDVGADVAPDFKTLRSLRILHGELDSSNNLVLVDRTTRHEWKNATATTPAVRRIVATVTSLSPFVLGYVLSPTIDAIVAPDAPVAVNTPVTLESTFTDPTSASLQAGDLFTAQWNWGDGTIESGTVTAPQISGGVEQPGKVTGVHTYLMAGVYTVTLTVHDGTAEGGSATQVHRYVVVYDPSAGFVTGGGWIESPAGAYAARPLVSGKATFGFVSKYERGANVPSGNTRFEFHAGDFSFKSTVYEWLVIAGPKAQYKGRGAVNGAGDYAFLLTATDGQVNGGGGIDRFRIKVWDRVTGAVVYDNVTGGGDDLETANPQAIGGGSIVIHNR
jgi:hypothetical protein